MCILSTARKIKYHMSISTSISEHSAKTIIIITIFVSKSKLWRNANYIFFVQLACGVRMCILDTFSISYLAIINCFALNLNSSSNRVNFQYLFVCHRVTGAVIVVHNKPPKTMVPNVNETRGKNSIMFFFAIK